jgi:hypothetical protein
VVAFSRYDLWDRDFPGPDISGGKQLQHKIKDRLAMINLHFKAREDARTGPVIVAKKGVATKGPELPFLYQG